MDERNITNEFKEVIGEYVDILKNQMNAHAEYMDETTLAMTKKSVETSERMITLAIEFMGKQEKTMERLNKFLDTQEI